MGNIFSNKNKQSKTDTNKSGLSGDDLNKINQLMFINFILAIMFI